MRRKGEEEWQEWVQGKVLGRVGFVFVRPTSSTYVVVCEGPATSIMSLTVLFIVSHCPSPLSSSSQRSAQGSQLRAG